VRNGTEAVPYRTVAISYRIRTSKLIGTEEALTKMKTLEREIEAYSRKHLWPRAAEMP
jgi:hypothetical protein